MKRIPPPSFKVIFYSAVILGFVTFLVRGYFPIGWTLDPVGFQLGHFPQYVFLFSVGIVAYRNDWISEFSSPEKMRWVLVAIVIVFVGFPLLYVVMKISGGDSDSFAGNYTLQSLPFSIWEQITGISVILSLLSIGRKYWNVTSPLSTLLSRASYGVYIFHPLLLISWSLIFYHISIEPLLKLPIVSILTLVTSFVISTLLCRIPLVKEVL